MQVKLQRLQQEYASAQEDVAKTRQSAAGDIKDLHKLAHTKVHQMQVILELRELAAGLRSAGSPCCSWCTLLTIGECDSETKTCVYVMRLETIYLFVQVPTGIAFVMSSCRRFVFFADL